MQQTPTTTAPQEVITERELPMLAGIGAFVTWCEDLLNILSGPVITAGLVIALVALLTDGDLLVKIPAMMYIWAVSMALGVDAQFVGSAAKAARAIRQRRYWAAFGYFVLCGALGYVGYIASNVFATQEAQGITMAQALQHLGMDGSMWIFQRSFLAVVLVFLSGFLRYVAPGKNVAASTAEERERLQAEIELEPLRQQLRAQQMRGIRGAGAALLGRENQQQPQPQPVKLRNVAAGFAAPETRPLEHRLMVNYREVHDGQGDYDPYGLPEGVPDEAVYEYDDPNITAAYSEAELMADVFAQTNDMPKRSRSGASSGPTKKTKTHGELVSEGMKKSYKERKREAIERRGRTIEADCDTILDAWHAAGRPKGLTDGKLATEVFKLGHLKVKPTDNTVGRYRPKWEKKRKREARDIIAETGQQTPEPELAEVLP